MLASTASPTQRHRTLSRCLCLLLLSLLNLLPALADPDAVSAIIDMARISPAPPVSPNFVGFSLETSSATGWVGAGNATTKASFLTLMRQLLLTPNAPGTVLRIGGNSADTSWWNPNHLPSPPNITYGIQPTDVISVTDAVKALNGSVVFGVNFRRGNDSSWAVAHAQGIAQYGDWSCTTLEIGNECDLYGGNGIRSSSYNYSQYDKEWSAYAAAIAAAVPSAPARLFQGATWAARTWYPNLTQYATEHQSVLSSVSVHTYPTTHCNGANVTVAQLLTDAASQTEANALTALQLPANIAALGFPLIMGEGNSASCGGFPGVSNVFVSALWLIDDAYNLAAAGVRRMNLHGGGSSLTSYSALVWASATATQPTVQPLFYGALLFAMATRNYPSIIPFTPTQSTNPLIKLHATWDGARMSVMVIHKDPTKRVNESATVILAFPAPATFTFPVASVRRLEALSVTERYNISLAGRTFQGTTDGTIKGAEVVEAVQPVRLVGSGQYSLSVLPASAVLLEWEVTAAEALKLRRPTPMTYMRDL